MSIYFLENVVINSLIIDKSQVLKNIIDIKQKLLYNNIENKRKEVEA